MGQPKKSQQRQRTPKLSQISRTINAVLEATITLLLQQGFRALTVEKISNLSGVARSTIYRHWEGVPDIAISAIEKTLGPVHTTANQENVRNTLVAHYKKYAEILKSGPHGRLLPSLIEASHHDARFKVLYETMVVSRTAATADIIDHGIKAGKLPPDTPTEWIIDYIGGALHHRILITGGDINELGFIEWLIDSALSQL